MEDTEIEIGKLTAATEILSSGIQKEFSMDMMIETIGCMKPAAENELVVPFRSVNPVGKTFFHKNTTTINIPKAMMERIYKDKPQEQAVFRWLATKLGYAEFLSPIYGVPKNAVVKVKKPKESTVGKSFNELCSL